MPSVALPFLICEMGIVRHLLPTLGPPARTESGLGTTESTFFQEGGCHAFGNVWPQGRKEAGRGPGIVFVRTPAHPLYLLLLFLSSPWGRESRIFLAASSRPLASQAHTSGPHIPALL